MIVNAYQKIRNKIADFKCFINLMIQTVFLFFLSDNLR